MRGALTYASTLWDEWDEWDEWRMIPCGLGDSKGWTPKLPDQPVCRDRCGAGRPK